MISNPKIGFKRYPGFSLLFDNPGEQHMLSIWEAGKLLKLNTAIDSGSESELYRHLRDGLGEIGLFTNDNPYLFFVLPPSTYHVTVWDGFNEGNKQSAFPSYHQEIFEFFEGLPLSLMFDNPFSRSIKASPLLQKRWDIQFEFKKLSIWGNVSLVVQLKPSNPSSESQFAEIEAHRSELYRRFEKEFGLTRWYPEFSPHITLGYFGNEEGVKKAHLRVQEWNNSLLKIASDASIQFSSIGFYGFTDMVNFFRFNPS
jgi:2'-5' RNA ligase